MADTKTSALTALSAAPATGDLLPIVDVSDTTMAASGTTKYITIANVLTTPTVNGLLTVTQATANAGILASTGYSLTGSDATGMINLAGTWNTSGTPTAFKINITDTASNAASLLLDLQVGSAFKFKVQKDGRVFASTMTMGLGDGVHWDGDSQYFNSDSTLSWSSSATQNFTKDTGIYRNAAGVLEINNGTAGTFRDLKVRDIIIDSGTMVKSSTAFTDGAAAQTATMTNGPAAGNPTKWIPINDNGTTRYIPAW